MKAKQIYHRLKKGRELSIIRLHRRKMWVSEWIAIFRKRGLYKGIHWTKEQKAEFDAFWKQHYGQRISPRWHKLFQSINGVFDVRYFPSILFSTKLEVRLNPFILSEQLQSKTFPDILFGYSPDVRLPYTYAMCFNGYCYDSKREVFSFESLLLSLANIGQCIIKPVFGGNSGRNFRILNLISGFDVRCGISLQDIVNEYKGNFIIQEKLEQCDAVKKLHPSSINTFRVITYICNDKVYHCPISLRIGSGGSNVDNLHAGGMVVGVLDDGQLTEKAYYIGYSYCKDIYYKHPDSGISFAGYYIPNFDRIINATSRLHGRLPGIGIVSWDMILDKNEKPVVIEVNLVGQSKEFPQIVNNCSLFGDNSATMIKMIRKSS